MVASLRKRLSRLVPLFAAAILAAAAAGCVAVGPDQFASSLAKGAAAGAGPQGAEASPSRRQLWLIPSQRQGLTMRAYVYRPPGNGPFPLAVVNHGSDQNATRRAAQPMPTFDAMTAWLVARGYAVVIPQRPGHGQTGGPYIEDQGFCEAPSYVRSGNATADAIAATIAYMTTQPFIRPNGVLVVGNSAGGWGALALAARNPPTVAKVAVFSAGRGGRDRDIALRNCGPDRLVAAAGDFGKSARIPVLWLSAENDTYFSPDLTRRMTEAYRGGGAPLEYRLLPPVGAEGHVLILDATAWQPAMQAFLGR